MKTKHLLLTLLFALVGGFLASYVYSKNTSPRVQMFQNTAQPAQLASYAPNLQGTNIDFTYAAEKTIHAVVHVKVKSMQNYSGSIFDFFFGYRDTPMQQQEVEGFGSGVIISPDGYIITNNHVIKNADDIEVTLNDKRTYTAKLIGADPNTDIALIKVDAKELPVIPYGDSDGLKVGEWVLAVGNPYNLTSTVTAGIVSAKSRQLGIIQPGEDSEDSYQQYGYPGQAQRRNQSAQNRSTMAIESFIQTDAAVNPGNSGGALVNVRGELVGINTAIQSRTGSYSGNSFAVPTSIVKKVVADLIEYGAVQRAYLGISMRDINSELAQEYDLDQIKGVYVEEVLEGSAAEKAGIQKGDVVTAINGVEVNSGSQIQEQISKFRPSDKVQVQYVRKGKTANVTATLRDRSGSTDVIARAEDTEVNLGVVFSPVSDQLKNRLRLENGVQVKEVLQGKFRKAGIQEGFIIVRVDKQSVESGSDVQEILKDAKGAILIEGIYPNGVKYAYALQM